MVLQTWQFVLIIIIAFVGYPIGLLISRFTKDELQDGKKWFKLIMMLSAIVIIASLFFFSNLESLVFLISSLIFIFLIALASFIKAKKQAKKYYKKQN